MKQCPLCNRAYTDDSLKFCLDDGSILVTVPDAEATVVRPRQANPRFQRDAALRSQHSSRSPLRWVLYGGMLLLAVLVGAGAVLLLNELKRPRSTSPVITQRGTPTPSSDNQAATPTPERLPSPPSPDENNRKDSRVTGVQSLSGEWNLVNTIEKTSYASYSNLQIGYRIVINHAGREFTGEGEKVSENGETLPTGSRTPIHLKGFVDGARAGAT